MCGSVLEIDLISDCIALLHLVTLDLGCFELKPDLSMVGQKLICKIEVVRAQSSGKGVSEIGSSSIKCRGRIHMSC